MFKLIIKMTEGQDDEVEIFENMQDLDRYKTELMQESVFNEPAFTEDDFTIEQF